MNFQASNRDLQEWSELISAVVEATISQTQPTLNQLLKQVLYVIPSGQPDSLRAQIASHLLIQIARGLEQSLESPTHPTIAWFVAYVGFGSAPPEAVQAVQMVLEKGFKPFEDFFVDRQGIHFYDHGATPEKLDKIPERLSEFTQMTIRVNSSEIKQIVERFNLSDEQARTVLVNLKILEQKMKLPIAQLLSVLDHNEGLLRQVLESDLTKSDNKNDFL